MELLKQAKCEHQHHASKLTTQEPPISTSPPPPVVAVGEGVAIEAKDKEEAFTEQHREDRGREGAVKGIARGGGEEAEDEMLTGRGGERSTAGWAGRRGGERSTAKWSGGKGGERSTGEQGCGGSEGSTGEQDGGRGGERAVLMESWMAGVGGEPETSDMAMDILELENTAPKVSGKLKSN